MAASSASASGASSSSASASSSSSQRVAIVTGATSGLGYELAYTLAAYARVHVVVTGRDEGRVRAACVRMQVRAEEESRADPCAWRRNVRRWKNGERTRRGSESRRRRPDALAGAQDAQDAEDAEDGGDDGDDDLSDDDLSDDELEDDLDSSRATRRRPRSFATVRDVVAAWTQASPLGWLRSLLRYRAVSASADSTAATDATDDAVTLHLTPMLLDVASLDSVRAFTDAFRATDLPLHYLVNNAGIIAGAISASCDGIESTMATNHLGHFFLTMQLLPVMLRTLGIRARPGARSAEGEGDAGDAGDGDNAVNGDNGDNAGDAGDAGATPIALGCIVNVASLAHRYSDLSYSSLRRAFVPPRVVLGSTSLLDAWQAYHDSKLCQVLHASYLAHHLTNAFEGPTATSALPLLVCSAAPGIVRTPIGEQRWSTRILCAVAGPLCFRTVPQGTASILAPIELVRRIERQMARATARRRAAARSAAAAAAQREAASVTSATQNDESVELIEPLEDVDLELGPSAASTTNGAHDGRGRRKTKKNTAGAHDGAHDGDAAWAKAALDRLRAFQGAYLEDGRFGHRSARSVHLPLAEAVWDVSLACVERYEERRRGVA